MTVKAEDRIKPIYGILDKEYPDARCALNYKEPYELLIATRLSAQCTDARVNEVTRVLFKKYTSLEAFAAADYGELCKDVYSCGFYREKAKSIIETCGILLSEYGGKLPDDLELLTKLPGVGRKTANLLLGEVYHRPAVVADTHCIRLSNRLGLSKSTDPYKTEIALKNAVPENMQLRLCHLFVFHGRAVCLSRRPMCGECALSGVCPKIDVPAAKSGGK